MPTIATKLVGQMSSLASIVKFMVKHPLTHDDKGRAFARFIHWQLASRLRPEVIVPWIDGTRLAVRRGMTGATGNIYCGLHEFEDMAFLLHFLRPQDLFVDIGANIGSYTLLASGVRRARTVAFEPDPVTFAALSRNIALNALEALVLAHECALGPNTGRIEFTVGLDTLNHVARPGGGPTRIVAMDTLDHALSGESPILLKLDVEGYEAQILKGAAATLHSSRLKAILTEDRSAAVTETLQQSGYREFQYNPFTRRLARGEKQGPGGNALFVRESSFVQERLSEAKRVHVLNRWF